MRVAGVRDRAGRMFLQPGELVSPARGREIAKAQQPTPGSEQPYPNLASVPPVPTPPNQAELNAITNGLIADRTHAQYPANTAPLPDPSSPQASPGLFGVGTATPPAPPARTPGASSPGAPVATASLPAATAPPPPPTAPTPPPVAAAPPPAPVARPAAAAPAAPLRAPVAPVQSTPLPTVVPTPAAPVLPGPVPQMSSAPPTPPPFAEVPARPTPQPTTSADTVAVAFGAGSAALTEGDVAALKGLAARRGNKVVEALGHGDGAGNAPAAQQQAVTLGFARAQAIAKALRDAGVPESAIQVMSLAGGRGGAAKLVEWPLPAWTICLRRMSSTVSDACRLMCLPR